MLTISKISSEGSGYYGKDNYYTQGEEGVGSWFGKGAERLGLVGAIENDKLDLMLNGDFDGVQLGRINDKDEAEHHPGWDHTFSAPKSVSVLALVAEDKRLIEAMEKAVDSTLGYIENNFSESRFRYNNAIENRKTGNIIVAKYLHDISRNGDANLHMHALILNATFGDNEKLRSLDSPVFYEHKMLMGAKFQSELALNVQEIGYKTNICHDGTFEIVHKDKESQQAFEEIQFKHSTRRTEILQDMEEKGRSGAIAAQQSTLETRPDKVELTKEEKRNKWNETTEVEGLALLGDFVKETDKERNPPTATSLKQNQELVSDKAVVDAIKHLSENEAVFKDIAIHRQAVVSSLGKCSFEQVGTAIKRSIQRGDLLHARVTEKSIKESEVLRVFRREKESIDPLIKAKDFSIDKTDVLTKSQTEAIKDILTTKDRFIRVQSLSSVDDKFSVLQKVKAQAEKQNIKIVGMSLDKPSATALEKVGIKAKSVKTHLHSLRKEELKEFVNLSDKQMQEKLVNWGVEAEVVKRWRYNVSEKILNNAIYKTINRPMKYSEDSNPAAYMYKILGDGRKLQLDDVLIKQNSSVKQNSGVTKPNEAKYLPGQKQLWVIEGEGFESKKQALEFSNIAIKENAQVVILGDINILKDKPTNILKKSYTTPELIEKERLTLKIMREERNKIQPIIDKELTLNRGKIFTKGQTESATTILKTKDRFVFVQGYAGTGKTFMFEEIKEQCDKQNIKVVGMSSSNDAANTLENETGIESKSIQKHLTQELREYIKEKSEQADNLPKQRELWIVDEASLVSTTQALAIVKRATKKNAQVVFAGDPKQIGAVEYGKPYAIGLKPKYGLTVAKMPEIIRQTNVGLRQAIYSATKGDIAASFSKLDSSFIEIRDKDGNDDPISRLKTAAGIYIALTPKERDKTLFITPVNENKFNFNNYVREGLKLDGTLGEKSIEFTNLVNKSLTRNERTKSYNYASHKNLIVRFNKANKKLNIDKNSYLRVDSFNHDNNEMTLIDAKNKNKKIIWNPQKNGSSSVEVYFENKRELSKGDLLFWRRSDKNKGEDRRTNAKIKILTVNRFTKNVRYVDLTTGEAKSMNMNNFKNKHVEWAYSMTAAQSQGQTASRTVNILESWRGKSVNQSTFYVSASRGKEEAIILTDDKEKLELQLTKETGEKQSGIEQITDIRKNKVADIYAKQQGHKTSEDIAREERQALESKTNKYIESLSLDKKNALEKEFRKTLAGSVRNVFDKAKDGSNQQNIYQGMLRNYIQANSVEAQKESMPQENTTETEKQAFERKTDAYLKSLSLEGKEALEKEFRSTICDTMLNVYDQYKDKEGSHMQETYQGQIRHYAKENRVVLQEQSQRRQINMQKQSKKQTPMEIIR